MARIPPEQLPQPIYPQQPGQPAAGAAPASGPGATGGSAGYGPSGFDAGGPKKRPPTALIAGIAGAVVVVIVIVVVLVLTLGGDKKGDASKGTTPGKVNPPASAPGGNGGNGGGGSQAKTAANNLVGQVPMPGGEYQCVVDALDGDSALAGAVVSGTANPTEVADLLVSCVSPGTIADAVTKDLSGQYASGSIACYRSNIASMDQATLTELLSSVLSGDIQSAQSILSYAAMGC